MGSTIREIRIHGVSGTPPEAMLDLESATDVERIAGDDVTGFWRRTPSGAAKLPAWMLPPTRSPLPWSPARPRLPWDVEAYSWGSLTSGARGSLSRAAWLLLIPFALVNVASWARPGLCRDPADTAGSSRLTFKADRGVAVIVRLTGLALTGLLIAAAATVSIGLIGYQCFRGGDLLCPSLPSQLHFLAGPGWEAPGRRVAVGAIGPLAMLGLLWWLGRVTVQRYEDTPDRSEGTDSTTAPATPTAGGGQKLYPHLLESMTMWNGRQRWRTLAGWHLVAGFATLLAIVGWVTAQIGGWGPAAVAGVAAAVLLAGLSVLGIARASDGPEAEGNHGTGDEAVRRGRDAWAARGAALGAAVITVAYLVWVGISGRRGRDFVDLTAFEVITTALVAFAGVGVVLGIVAWASGTGQWRRPAVMVAALIGPAVVGAFVVPPDWPWWILPLVVGVAVAAAVPVHSLTPGEQRRDWAFRGAGPGVMLGGALFVSLLFTTASVLGVVVWLTGPSGLASMPARYDRPTLCAAHEPDQSDAAMLSDCTTLVAFGDVELMDGEVSVDDDRLRVTSGRVSVESLAIAAGDGEVSTSIPSLTLDRDAVSVVLADDRALSSEEEPGSRASGTLIVPDPGTPGSPVTLTVDEGVRIETRQPPYQGELLVPPAIRTFATVFPIFLVLTGAILGAGWVRLAWKTRGSINARATADLAHATRQPPVDLPDALRQRRRTDSKRYGELPPYRGEQLVRAMGRLRRSSAFARRGEALLGRVAVVGGAGMLFAIVTALADLRRDESSSPAELPEKVQAAASALTVAGLYLAAGAAIGLLALGSAVRRDAAFRRPIGVLWDLSCFWPRVAHPFSPPCYAERAVPDLYERLNHYTRDDRRALLSGHSLGSFLAVAAICRLPHHYGDEAATTPRNNLGLLTYGSQLRYYWGRVFPGAFGPQVLGNRPAARLPLGQYEYPPPSNRCADAPAPGTLASQLGVRATPAKLGEPDVPCRWINLYRLTDPLGFTVFTDDRVSPDNRRAVDQPVFEVALTEPGDPTPPRLLGHSGYPLAPEYHAWAWRLTQRLPTTQPAPPEQ